MGKFRQKSTLVAMIVAAAALVVSLGGNAIATASATSASTGKAPASAAKAKKHAAKKHARKKKLTRAQKLKKALKQCKKDKTKKKRSTCEKNARKKYGKKPGKGKGHGTTPGEPVKTIKETVTVTVPERIVEHEVVSPPAPSTAELPAELGMGPAEAGGTQAISHANEIPLAPAWTPTQLNSWPTGNWIGPEGGTTGDHFSALKEINETNVQQLKGDWMTQLDRSGTGGGFSAEAAPTEYDGVDYYVTGADDVFAVSVANGKILWVHPGDIPLSTGPDICCGWDARGVSIGEGMVFTATLNGSVEALSQQTGQVVWRTELAQPAEGLTITSAPLYYEGMVFLGPVGAEYGVRGFLAALDAKTGTMIWKHWNIPAPGEVGHETWPTGKVAGYNGMNEEEAQIADQEWKHGGATTWDAPTVDPKRGIILYSTANAGNDNEGWYREGQNLWTVSILALNYKTGEMAWGYQEVHHDIWDYDASNQPTMINVEIGGKKVEGIVQANKDGFAYFVNDEEGKPVFPIEEEAVPTKKVDASYGTQPIPQMPPFYPQKVSEAELAEIQTSVNSAVKKANETLEKEGKKAVPVPTVVHGGYDEDDVFGAWAQAGETTAQISSDALSGDNEAPSSYDPDNGYYYVCSRRGLDYAYMTEAKKPVFKEGAQYAGEAFIAAAHIGHTGYLTAYNMHTGQVAWTKEWPHECYSGITTTAGNLLITGNVEGEMLVYNATTGQELLSFELGAAIGGPESVYEFDGKERIGIYAGGNDFNFASTKEAPGNVRGDQLWQLSLGGSLAPVEQNYYAKHGTEAPEIPKETTDY